MENSQKLLQRIKTEKIVPKSKSRFIIKNIIFWIIFIISLIIGGLAVSIILFAFIENELDLINNFTGSKLKMFLSFLPIFWIISAIIFLVLSIFGVRYTKTGYRYSPFLIISINIILSIILGITFYFTGGAKTIEQLFAKNISIYNSVEEKKVALWSNPEQGFLSGKIIEKNKENDFFTLEDFNQKKWKIEFKNADIKNRVTIQEKEQIKIIGKISQDDIFIAKEIRPWEGQGMQRNKNHSK